MSNRDKSTSIKRTLLSGLLLNLLVNGLLYLGHLLIARYLTRNEYATFTVVISSVSLLALFVDLGLNSLFVKFFAEADNLPPEEKRSELGRLFGSILFLRLTMAVIVCTVIIIIGSSLGYTPETVRLMVVFSLSLFISSRLLAVRAIGEAYLRGSGRYRTYMIFASIDAICFASSTALFIFSTLDLTAAIMLYTFSNLPGFILLMRLIYKDVKSENIIFHIDFLLIKKFIIKGAPLILACSFLTIHNTADPILLDKLSTPFEISAFAASMRVQSALIFLPSVFSGIIAPEIVKFIAANKIESAYQLVHKAIQVLLVVSCGLAFAVTSMPNIIITILLGGNKYTDIAPLITILAWAFVGIAYSLFVIEIAVAEGRQWLSLIYMMISMIASVSLDIMLIPSYGALGAVWARFGSIALASIAVNQLTRTMNTISQKSHQHFIGRLIVCIASCFLVHTISRALNFYEIIDGFLTITIYCLIALFLKLINIQDFHILFSFKSIRIRNGITATTK